MPTRRDQNHIPIKNLDTPINRVPHRPSEARSPSQAPIPSSHALNFEKGSRPVVAPSPGSPTYSPEERLGRHSASKLKFQHDTKRGRGQNSGSAALAGTGRQTAAGGIASSPV